MIKAFNDFVYLSWETPKKNKTEVSVSDVSATKPAVAKVIAVGPDAKQAKVGMEVVVDPFQPRQLKNVQGKDYYIIREKYIFGRIK